MGNASFVFFSLTYFMFSKYLQLKPRTIERGKNNGKTNMLHPLWFWRTLHHTPLWGCTRHHLHTLKKPATCLASLSAGSLWKGTAPCPAGRLPQKTSAAPSASFAGCVPFPGPSGCARHLVPLRKQNNLGQGWKETEIESGYKYLLTSTL